MLTIRVNASKQDDLGPAYLALNDGILDHITPTKAIRIARKRPGLFSSGKQRVSKLAVDFEDPLDSETLAKLIAEIRRIVGPTAQIEYKIE